MWVHTYTDVCTCRSHVGVGCFPFEEPACHKDLPLHAIICGDVELGTKPGNLQTWLMVSEEEERLRDVDSVTWVSRADSGEEERMRPRERMVLRYTTNANAGR